MCMYVYIYICVCAYVGIYICIYIYIHIWSCYGTMLWATAPYCSQISALNTIPSVVCSLLWGYDMECNEDMFVFSHQ